MLELMSKTILETVTIDGINFYRIKKDLHGNTRWLVHGVNFLPKRLKKTIYNPEETGKVIKSNANSLGFRKFRSKDLGVMFVTQAYKNELSEYATKINKIKNRE